MLTTTDGLPHDCPWVGACGCVENGSVCVCSHQHGMHGNAPVDYDGACTECACERFYRFGWVEPSPLLALFDYMLDLEVQR